ncbi:hypothetical protein TNCV_2065321 [Trichonephila clavipes]|nr:hypothetical protein TNCV_2065321 [Trichonephila clavipes]
MLFVDHHRLHEFEPSTTKDPPCRGEMHVKSVENSNVILLECLDSVAIEVSSRPKLTGIVQGKAFLHVLRRRPIGCPDSRKRTEIARSDGYDSEQHRLDYFSNDICTSRNGCRRK